MFGHGAKPLTFPLSLIRQCTLQSTLAGLYWRILRPFFASTYLVASIRLNQRVILEGVNGMFPAPPPLGKTITV
jgi:hypothetical protein